MGKTVKLSYGFQMPSCSVGCVLCLSACFLPRLKIGRNGGARGRTGRIPSASPFPETLPADLKVGVAKENRRRTGFACDCRRTVVYLDHQQGKEVVHAVTSDAGKPLWDAPLDEAFKDSQGPVGPRCTPLDR